jgi:hypothetical protein
MWRFAAEHFMLSRFKKGKILGYRISPKLQEREWIILDMEPVPLLAAAFPSEEIPGDTPHFMNPEVLKAADERGIDVTAEEDAATTQPETAETALVSVAQPVTGPEKMEEVLNSGMAFIGGLLEMATGQKLEPSGADGRMLHCTSTAIPVRWP